MRIWKARASEKLGIITARERAAMEYRDSLKERWKMDAQVGKISRFVCFAHPCLINIFMDMNSICSLPFLAGTDIFPNLFIKLRSSSGLCWRRGESRRSGGGIIRGLERPNRRQRESAWSLLNRHKPFARPSVVLCRLGWYHSVLVYVDEMHIIETYHPRSMSSLLATTIYNF